MPVVRRTPQVADKQFELDPEAASDVSAQPSGSISGDAILRSTTPSSCLPRAASARCITVPAANGKSTRIPGFTIAAASSGEIVRDR